MMRCLLAVALAAAACSSTDGSTAVTDAPDGYTGPVDLTVENHATATTIQSSPSGISCPPDCTAQFPMGTQVTLRFAGHANYLLGMWSNPCEQAGGDSFSCQVELTGSMTIEADGGQE